MILSLQSERQSVRLFATFPVFALGQAAATAMRPAGVQAQIALA